MRERIAVKLPLAEPVAVPVADSQIVKQMAWLTSVKPFKNKQLLFAADFILFFAGKHIHLRKQRNRGRNDSLLVTYLVPRVCPADCFPVWANANQFVNCSFTPVFSFAVLFITAVMVSAAAAKFAAAAL